MEPLRICRQAFFLFFPQVMPIVFVAIWTVQIGFFHQKIWLFFLIVPWHVIFNSSQSFTLMMFQLFFFSSFSEFVISVWFKTLPNHEMWLLFCFIYLFISLHILEILRVEKLFIIDSWKNLLSCAVNFFFSNHFLLLREFFLIRASWIANKIFLA